MEKRCLVIMTVFAFGLASGHASEFSPEPTEPKDPFPNAAKILKLYFDLGPQFHVDLDITKRLINLTPDLNDDNQGVLDDYQNGFRYIQLKSWTVGAGFGGGWNLGPGTNKFTALFPFVGLMPIKGARVLVDRTIADRHEIETLPAPKSLMNAAQAATLLPGDSASFQTKGGLLFLGGTSYFANAVSMGLVATGEWTTQIEKKSENTISAKITNSKILGLNGAIGSTLLSLSASLYREYDKGFCYLFDLSQPIAAEAFQAFVRGNAVPAQTLAEVAYSGVTADFSFKAVARGRFGHLWFGVPLVLNSLKTKGMIQQQGVVLEHADGSQSNVQYGIYLKDRLAKVFKKRVNQTETFLGAAISIPDENGVIATDYFGKFAWSYENNRAHDSSLSKAIARLSNLTGQGDALRLDFPETDDLGYIQVSYTASMSHELIDALMNMSDLKDHPKVSNEVTLALKEMNAAKNKDWKAFTAAYARFGKAWLKSPESFQQLNQIMRSRGLDIEYVVEGERISRVVKKL